MGKIDLIELRHVRLDPFKSLTLLSLRRSYRRGVIYYFRNKTKDKVWHRACKRSIKHYERQALIDEIFIYE